MFRGLPHFSAAHLPHLFKSRTFPSLPTLDGFLDFRSLSAAEVRMYGGFLRQLLYTKLSGFRSSTPIQEAFFSHECPTLFLQVVNYEAGGLKKGLGTNVANKYGLSEAESEVYRRSLTDLCGHMMRASRESIASRASSRRSDATVSSLNAEKYGLNEAEKDVYRRSLGNLCNQMLRASQGSLSRSDGRSATMDKVSR